MQVHNLLLRVRPGEHEPAFSVLDRLALRHLLTSASALAKQIHLLPRNFAAEVGAGSHIDTVASLARVDPVSLRRSTLVHARGRMGVKLVNPPESASGALAFRPGRICPACLSDDLDLRGGREQTRPYRRFWWEIDFIACCPMHRLPLVESCTACGWRLSRLSTSARFCSCGNDLAQRPSGVLPSSELDADTYVLRRLVGEYPGTSSLLDGMTIREIVPLIEHVGVLGTPDGENERPETAPDLAIWRSRVRTRGLKAFANWPHDFMLALDRLVKNKASREKKGLGLHYGTLHMWLAHSRRSEAFAPVRQAMKEHAMLRFTAHHATMLFRSDQIDGGRLTLSAAAELCRVAPVSMLRLLNHLGMTSAKSPSFNVDCTREEAERAKRWLETHVGRKEAMERLGVSRVIFGRLLRMGHVKVAARNIGSGRQCMFSTTDLDGLLHRTTGKSRRCRSLPADARVVAIARTSEPPVEDIVAALINGNLQCVGRLDGAIGFAAQCVRRRDLARLHADACRPLDGADSMLDRIEVMRRTGIEIPAHLYELADRGYFGEHAHRGYGSLRRIAIGQDAVQAFIRDWVTIRGLCRSMRLGVSSQAARRILIRAGVKPVVCGQYGIYPRKAAERVFRQLAMTPRCASD